MINFNYETGFSIANEVEKLTWINSVISQEGFNLGELNYIFCDDDYLHKINVKFLNHDTLTDIISFDYTDGKTINGDIYISVDRVKENANTFQVSFNNELNRVMVHGVLHFCGYKDKSEEEKRVMRAKENFYLEESN